MITDIKFNPKDWKKDVYIANKLDVVLDDEGNEVVEYDEPVKYSFTVNSVSTSAEIAEFGERANVMRKIVVPIKYEGIFNEFDVAYVDTTPDDEEIFGQNADYRLLPPRVGNAIVIIYLEKILGK